MSSSDHANVFRQLPDALTDRTAQLEPFEWYARMRAESPVRYDERRGTWDLFRYADVERVLTDDRVFSSDRARRPDGGPERGDSNADETTANDRSPAKSMITVDPPEHDRLRGFVDERFQPGSIREQRPLIERAAADALDRAISDRDAENEGSEGNEGNGRDSFAFDIVSEFAYPFPVGVIASLLNIPIADRERFKRWSDAVVSSPEESTPAALEASQEEAERLRREMARYFGERLDDRSGGDGNDLITLAANTRELTRREKISFCILLLVAGNITTTNLITNAIWCFAEHGITDEIRTGAIDRQKAIEEVLRYRSPVQSITRVTTEPVELDGTEIDAGESITAWNGAANRDPKVFDAPDDFLPERRGNRHIAFGKGIHYCLGAPLARLEADVALEVLLNRFERIEPIDAPRQPITSRLLYGLTELPCRVTERE